MQLVQKFDIMVKSANRRMKKATSAKGDSYELICFNLYSYLIEKKAILQGLFEYCLECFFHSFIKREGVFVMSKCVVLPVDVFQVEGLSIYDQMCYMVIRSFMNGKTKSAFPSYDTIAKLGRMSRRKAIECVKILVEKGLLRKESRPSSNDKKDNTSNLYHFPSEQHAPSKEQHAPSTPQKPSEQHAPKQKDFKHLLTNKMNRIAPMPDYILNQPTKHNDDISEADKQEIEELMNKLDKVSIFAQNTA